MTKMAKNILVVDDEELVLIALDALLSPSGYEVTTANNGDDALEKLNKKKFDLMILDILMPGMNGFELCEKIRSLDEYKVVPIIMLTAKSGSEDKKKGMEMGANLFLPKPIAPQHLIDLIKKSLE
jgi:DNA-binding response OmpR family regulator